MSEYTAKNISINNFSSITKDLSVQNFLNYKPNRIKAQDFDSPRSNRPLHEGIDYGSKAGITLGTEINAVQGGVATPIYEYYKNRATGITDAGIKVTGKDSQGRTIETTYGHLDRKSVERFFNRKESINVKAGDVLAKVGTTGKIRDGQGSNNEYHVHVKVQVKGQARKLNPLTYFQQEYKVQKLNENILQESSQSDNTKYDLYTTNVDQTVQNESIAMQRYQAIADLLKDAGIQPGSSDWNKAIVQTAIGTDLNVNDIKDIAKQIPGIKPNEAEKLVDGATKDVQVALT